jgi:NAD(P)-dependent dehydrogenase (short-subunit alcohol dehydrogenase family)
LVHPIAGLPVANMTTSKKPLAGKTVLVTGAGGGLGKAIAAKFVGAGANVVICDVHEERLKEASAELSTKGTVKAVVADITSEESIQNLFGETTKEFNRLDILVNNAGIMDRFDPVGDLDRALWDKVIAVNLTAPYLLSKEAVRIMLAQPEPKGSILNISSLAGKAGGMAGMYFSLSPHTGGLL